MADALRAVYSSSELAAMLGMSRKRFVRWLRAERVQTWQVGRYTYVGLAAFKNAFPEAFESLLVQRMIRRPARAECPACGSSVRM